MSVEGCFLPMDRLLWQAGISCYKIRRSPRGPGQSCGLRPLPHERQRQGIKGPHWPRRGWPYPRAGRGSAGFFPGSLPGPLRRQDKLPGVVPGYPGKGATADCQLLAQRSPPPAAHCLPSLQQTSSCSRGTFPEGPSTGDSLPLVGQSWTAGLACFSLASGLARRPAAFATRGAGALVRKSPNFLNMCVN